MRPVMPESQQISPRAAPTGGDAVYAAPATQVDQTPPLPPARPVVSPTFSEQAPLGSVPPQRPMEAGRQTAPLSDDDTPTLESAIGAPDVGTAPRRYADPQAREPNSDVTQEAETAETAFAQDTATADRLANEEPLRRFFFGRKLNDDDDTFQSEDAPNKDRNRDFQW
jgi:hypothetical protein